ncbi:hypothetical protein H5410_063665 [Solanum commersonii]|uniref:Uncharacterized protein n=1 Tax=Solanum commersonii TaxID=4109 RepID=A0A9J5WDU6_SOLCO|nr:hypothetical protein H5410_063665 [Solanum commersonii]
MLLAHDRSKIVDSNHIKMVDDLDFFKSYLWGKECFDLTVWIYEIFPHLGKYAKKSWILLCPLSGYLDGTRQRAIILSKIGHPYVTPTVCVTKQNYMATLNPYTNEVNDTIIDALKANLKGVIVLTLAIENEEDYTLPTVDEDGASVNVDEILPLAIVDEDLVAVDGYFAEEVNEQEEEKMKEKEETKKKKKREMEEKKQEEEKMEEKDEEKEEKKQEENKEEEIEEKKEEEKEEEKQEEDQEKEEEKQEEEEKEEEKQEEEEKNKRSRNKM